MTSQSDAITQALVQELLAKGIASARAGQRRSARRYLSQATTIDPTNEKAWLWLSGVVDDYQLMLACLNRVLTLNPYNPHAQAGAQWVRARIAVRAHAGLRSVRGRPRHPADTFDDKLPPWIAEQLPEHQAAQPAHAARPAGRRGWVWMALIVAVAVLSLLLILLVVRPAGAAAWLPFLATPTPTILERTTALFTEFEAAWDERDWASALNYLAQIEALEADHPNLRECKWATHLFWGQQLAAEGQLHEALAHFEQALEVMPDEPIAHWEQTITSHYLIGEARYAAGDWAEAVDHLSTVYGMDKDFHDVRPLLADAHYQLAHQFRESGQLVEAQAEYERTLEIAPDDQDAQDGLAEVVALLVPPAPTPTPVPSPPTQTGKRIEVNLTEQHLYVWEDDLLIHDWVCSTGGYGSPTVPGNYHVLDKIPNAYASTWDLQMPYWLGIYYAGNLENGIHALPILSSGQLLWEGYLGQRVSYGCVILSTEAARTLYHWAEIGTPVTITY
ncbi:MAG: L,D-transpeptidase family protein [Chloroflexota bacterium]|nr:L,D-transpeptidase family protein [Chloroflexota bacterium]